MTQGVINLDKGGMLNLSKTAPSLKRVRVGLGWNPNQTDTGAAFDIDVSAFVLKNDAAGNPAVISPQHFVFYGNLKSPEGAVVHQGDNRTGEGDGDDESIVLDLAKLPVGTDEVSFIVTIYEGAQRKQNFGQVRGSYIAIYDDETGQKISEYKLRDEFSTETAVQFGSIEKNGSGQFVFAAVGQGYNKGLSDFVNRYGLNASGG
jgi:tellurium resistance protein TerD